MFAHPTRPFLKLKTFAVVGRGRGPRRGGIAFNSCLFAHFFGSGQELQMKLQPGTPVETNDVHALSISFSSGEFLRVLREQKPRELENKKRRNITVDSRRDVWIFRQHTAFLHHPLNSKGHGRIFQEYCTVQWCVPCPSSLVVTRSAQTENSNSSPLAKGGRPGLDLPRLPCCTMTKNADGAHAITFLL